MTLVIVFGKKAIGKTRVGKQLAEYLEYKYFDGDDVLSPFNKKYGFYSKAQVETYVKNNLIPETEKRINEAKNLVVSQALYFEEHRKLIKEHFKNHQVIYVHIIAPPDQHDDQLWQQGYYWYAYGKANSYFFEQSVNAFKIYNIKEMDGESAYLKTQFKEFKRIKTLK